MDTLYNVKRVWEERGVSLGMWWEAKSKRTRHEHSMREASTESYMMHDNPWGAAACRVTQPLLRLCTMELHQTWFVNWKSTLFSNYELSTVLVVPHDANLVCKLLNQSFSKTRAVTKVTTFFLLAFGAGVCSCVRVWSCLTPRAASNAYRSNFGF